MTHRTMAQNTDTKPSEKKPNHQMIESMAVELAILSLIEEKDVQSFQIVQNAKDACRGIQSSTCH